jgi:hypothetical protein
VLLRLQRVVAFLLSSKHSRSSSHLLYCIECYRTRRHRAAVVFAWLARFQKRNEKAAPHWWELPPLSKCVLVIDKNMTVRLAVFSKMSLIKYIVAEPKTKSANKKGLMYSTTG